MTRTFRLSLLALAAVVLLPADVSSHSPRYIAYFDPDANHQAILQIRRWFNDFLQSAGLDLQFQAVQSRAQLDELVKSGNVDFAIVASSQVREAGGVFRPLLVPEAQGQTFYRKLLVDRGGSTPASIAGKNIAATLGEVGDKGESVLQMLKKGGVAVDGTIVIPVSKDIDALLALSFGQVQAALVTPGSVEVLKHINPADAAALRTVFETKKILRSPLCVVNASPEAQKQLVEAFQRMQADERGKKALAMLGFERWVSFQTSMLGGER